MADIFISYARGDRDKIEKLAAALEGEGFSVWWDRHIAGGAEFSDDIERELNAARAVIVAWSREGAKSRWVKDEAGIAANAGKLVAICLDGEEPPIGFKQFHAIDYARASPAALEDIKRSVALKLDRAPGPSTSAPAPSRAPVKNLAIAAAIAIGVLSIGYALYVNLAQRSPDTPLVAEQSVPTEAAVSPGEFQSIAVLAFADLSPERDQEYFSDGIAEELLNLLAKKTDLRVAARTSSFAFKGKNENVSAIGEALNVDAVLEGSVRKAGDRVRITAQLIDARTGFHLWSETFDRELADVFAVQDEIAGAIVSALPTVVGDVGADESRRIDNAAYDFYLQGRYQLTLRTRASIEKAQELFERSVAIDPEYAPAWAELALSTLLLAAGPNTYGDLTFEEVQADAEPAVAKALALEPTLAEAYVAQGLLRNHQNDFPGSIASYRKAIELNPSVANARHLLYLVLYMEGEFREAFDVIDRAVELDPLSAITLENQVSSLAARGRFEDALAAAQRLYALHPDWPHSTTSWSHAHAANGDFAEAVQLIEAAARASGSDNLDTNVAFNLINIKIFEHPRVKAAPIHPASFLAVIEGRHDEARSLALRNFEENPQDPFALWRAVWTLWATGEDQAALDLAEEHAVPQAEATNVWAVHRASCYPGLYIAGLRQRSGDVDGAQAPLKACRETLAGAERQGFIIPYFERDMKAELLVLEGRQEEALQELRKLVDSGLFISWWIGIEPIYEPLRGDPRFQAIVAELNTRAEQHGARYRALVERDTRE